jgi:signal transduction histidine kinase
MANLPTSASGQAAIPHFGERAALYVTIVAFSGVTLISQPAMFTDGRWLPYVIGVAAFGLVSDRATRAHQLSPALAGSVLIFLAAVLIGLSVLAEYYFLTAMLSFISVSVAESLLPPRRTLTHHGLLLLTLTVAIGLGTNFSAAIQFGLGLSAGFVFIIAFVRLAEREHQAHRQLEAANRQLADYAAQVERLATTRERTRLARDVHDSLGHYLTVIDAQLKVVDDLLESDPTKAREAAQRAQELTAEGLAEVRRSILALRPSTLDDQPLFEAIQGLIKTAQEAGLAVSSRQLGLIRPLRPECETVIYRAVQESLTNIREHAHATTAEVRLAYEASVVRLRVRDNGLGQHDDTDKVGLNLLHERVTALNGSLLAENHPDGGFLLEVQLPA